MHVCSQNFVLSVPPLHLTLKFGTFFSIDFNKLKCCKGCGGEGSPSRNSRKYLTCRCSYTEHFDFFALKARARLSFSFLDPCLLHLSSATLILEEGKEGWNNEAK